MNTDFEKDFSIAHAYSLTPRLKITDSEEQTGLKAGDIIVAVGDVNYPTFADLREVATRNEGKNLSIKVLRADANDRLDELTINTVPQENPATGDVVIGIETSADAAHPVIAKTIENPQSEKLDMPPGAEITRVGGRKVSNFFDIINAIRDSAGKNIEIEYVSDGEQASVSLTPQNPDEAITLETALAVDLPLKTLDRLYKASGPVEALSMGVNRTIKFIAMTYASIKAMIVGKVGGQNVMGPVGIISASYTIVAEKSLPDFAYFLGLISVAIAVFNFLPLPPLDGGLIVVLLAEKIKGSAISINTQAAIQYAGWAAIGMLVIYVTYNDIMRLVTGFFG